MLLVLHIIVALSSLIITGYTYFHPSKIKLNLAYSFVALTFISGTGLIITKPSHLMQTCIEGLIYLGVVSFGLILTRHKLAAKMV